MTLACDSVDSPIDTNLILLNPGRPETASGKGGAVQDKIRKEVIRPSTKVTDIAQAKLCMYKNMSIF